jgi:hypothetical protein
VNVLNKLIAIREHQFGFNKGHPTTHALLRVLECITVGFNNKTERLVLFLNIEIAFDKSVDNRVNFRTHGGRNFCSVCTYYITTSIAESSDLFAEALNLADALFWQECLKAAC